MDDSNIQESIDDIDGNHEMFRSSSDTSGIVDGHGQGSQNFFVNLLEYSVLFGAEKVLMARKLPGPLVFSNMDSSSCSLNQDNYSEARRSGKNAMQFDENECGINTQCSVLQSRSSNGLECSDKYVQLSKTIDSPSDFYNDFPLDFVAFARNLTVVMLKLAGFQIDLFARFITLPIQLFNIWVTFLLFPFNALMFAREHLKKKLLTLWTNSCFSLIYFVCDRFTMQKSLLKLAVRFCWALFWSVYVCMILVGLFMLGFVVGGISMKNLVVEPIQTTENLNFDYTKVSPVSFVPITSSPVAGISPGLNSQGRIPFSKHIGVGGRTIPYNHKLLLIVSLTMPESEYNRNLGIFQVRIECLSVDGNVTASSSYPSMLQFKSQPIRYVETIFKSIPLLTGFQSEVQNLKIRAIDYTEGYEPTACFKVIIEQRAEYGAGSGIPEIYSASLHIESQLPQFKRIIWNWRRTIFVWISIMTFLTELMIAMIFCRPIILPGRTMLKAVGGKGKYRMNKISW